MGEGATARLSDRLERRTGYAGWSVVGAVSGLSLLGLAMIGLYWDIAWHVDFGRDKQVLTAPHLLILTALSGLMAVALLTIAMATATGAAVRLRLGRWRVPWSALLLLLVRAGGLLAFILDDLWHDAYGVDVTLLSPPHLGLLASGSFSAIAVWLMLFEGRTDAEPSRFGRFVHVVALGSMLIAFSTYQAELDYGMPLFSVLLLPVLLMAAAGLALVAARLSFGPGGAILAAVAFLVSRGAVAVLMGAMDHTVPHMALYLPAAVAVELAARWVGTDRPLRFALACAGLVATLGLAGEWAWQAAVGHHHIAGAAWPLALPLAGAAAVGGAVLGVAMTGRRLPPAATWIAGVLLVLAIAVPTQRRAGTVEATVTLDRLEGDAQVTVELRPATAARDADLFEVWSVQGDGRIRSPLRVIGPGLYRADRTVPVGGEWKTLVALYRGVEVMAFPIRLPAHPEIGASEVPAVTTRQAPFGAIGAVLLRETHDGPRRIAILVYGAFGVVLVVWLRFLRRAITAAVPIGPPATRR
ncbi:MAG TPA: hypothetical protein VM942_08245 [Acidimicrobiales bacterium]|nr:hypothetical protein [Acidimicrobiales bacterium]